MSHDFNDLRQRFLRQQQASLDELCKLPDPAKVLRELIRELHRRAPIQLGHRDGNFKPLRMPTPEQPTTRLAG